MGEFRFNGGPASETPVSTALYPMMLREASDQPGLLAATLIALAGGWAAGRLMRAALGPFPALIVGLTGAVAGAMLLGGLGFTPDAPGLLGMGVAGGLLVLAAARALPIWAEKWRNRNHVGRDEFDERGSTGTQEDPS